MKSLILFISVLIAFPALAVNKYTRVYDPHKICYNIGQNGANILLIGDSITSSQTGTNVPGWSSWVPRAWKMQGDLAWKGICILNSVNYNFGPAYIYTINDSVYCTHAAITQSVNQYHLPFSTNSNSTGAVDAPWFSQSMTLTLVAGQLIPKMNYSEAFLGGNEIYACGIGPSTPSLQPVTQMWNEEYYASIDPNMNWLIRGATNQTLKAKLIMDTNTLIEDFNIGTYSPGASTGYLNFRTNLDGNEVNNQIGSYTVTMPLCTGGYKQNGNGNNGEFEVTLGINQQREAKGEKINIIGCYWFIDDTNKGITITDGGKTAWETGTYQDPCLASLANMQAMAGIVGWDTVIITLGMNDMINGRTAQAAVDDLKTTIERFRATKPDLKFIVTTYYPTPHPWRSATLTVQQWMADYAELLMDLPDSFSDVAVINTWASFPNLYIMENLLVDSNNMTAETYALFSKDGVHLTMPGSYQYAKTIWDLISSQFEEKNFLRRIN